MQAQQTLALPRRSISLAVAVVATFVAAALALALLASTPHFAATAAPSVVVLHQDQAHGAQERASERAAPGVVVVRQDQTHAAQERASESAGS